jgi:hypothetical protein
MATTPLTASGKEREKTTRSVFNGSSLKPFFFPPPLFVSVFFLATLSLSLSLSLSACLLSSALQCGFFFWGDIFSNWRSLSVFIRQISKKIRQSRCEVAAGSQKT